MANEVSIFKDANAVSTAQRRGPSELAKSLAAEGTTRRIQTNTNGTFRRLINGEQIGDAVRGEINVIVVDALPKVSRVYYEREYDPNAKPTLPDCWSNLGDHPEASASNKQGASCTSCPKNVDGSGAKGKGRACRFQRRIAVLLEGDFSGDVYQLNVPAKSLFGKGTGNTHPFESYHRFLAANKEHIDTVATNISYNLNADSMELQFTAIRGLSDEEMDVVDAAKADPATRQLCVLTAAATDRVTATPVGVVGTTSEPTRRASNKPAGPAPAARETLASTINDWK